MRTVFDPPLFLLPPSTYLNVSVKELVCSSETTGCPNSPIMAVRFAPTIAEVGVNGFGCFMAMTCAQPDSMKQVAKRKRFLVFILFYVWIVNFIRLIL